MGKSAHNDAIDNGPNYVKTNGNKMVLCSAEPTTYTEANVTFKLAEVAMASGDYTNADGDVNGRKLTVAVKNGVPVSATGTSNHVAIVDTVASKVLYVTTHTAQALTSGNTVNIGSWKIEVADPT